MPNYAIESMRQAMTAGHRGAGDGVGGDSRWEAPAFEDPSP